LPCSRGPILNSTGSPRAGRSTNDSTLSPPVARTSSTWPVTGDESDPPPPQASAASSRITTKVLNNQRHTGRAWGSSFEWGTRRARRRQRDHGGGRGGPEDDPDDHRHEEETARGQQDAALIEATEDGVEHWSQDCSEEAADARAEERHRGHPGRRLARAGVIGP